MFDIETITLITGGIWKTGEISAPKFDRILTDSRGDCSNAMFLALTGERFDGHDFIDAAVEAGAGVLCVAHQRQDVLKKHPNIPALLVRDTLEAYQTMALQKRLSMKNLTVIGVTGSSGKTSTKEIVKAVMEEAFGPEHVYATTGNTNNHVGVPQNLLNLTECHDVAIIEMGTNHPGEIDVLTRLARPDLAIISSIGPCHLEFFHDLEGVAKEKSTIFNGLGPAGTAILPAVSPGLRQLLDASKSYKRLTFGEDDTADVQAIYHGGTINGATFDLKWRESGTTKRVEWKLQGRHQARNAAAAAAVATALGITPETIVEGLGNATLPGMRMKIEEIEGVTWINDAYNANPDSVKAGLEWLAEFAVSSSTRLVLGDMLEMGDAAAEGHRDVLTLARERFPDSAIFAVGPDMTKASATLGTNSLLGCYESAATAAADVRNGLEKGDIVFVKASRGMRLEQILPKS